MYLRMLMSWPAPSVRTVRNGTVLNILEVSGSVRLSAPELEPLWRWEFCCKWISAVLGESAVLTYFLLLLLSPTWLPKAKFCVQLISAVRSLKLNRFSELQRWTGAADGPAARSRGLLFCSIKVSCDHAIWHYAPTSCFFSPHETNTNIEYVYMCQMKLPVLLYSTLLQKQPEQGLI